MADPPAPPVPQAKPRVSIEDEKDPDGPAVGPNGRRKVAYYRRGVSRALVISAALLCSVWLF